MNSFLHTNDNTDTYEQLRLLQRLGLRHFTRFPPLRVLFMAALTLTYLSVEAPFAALVVDVIGAKETSTADLDSLEHAGKLISGCAVAVAVVGWWLSRCHRLEFNVAQTLCGLVMAATLPIAVTYWAEGQLISAIGRMSGAEFRQGAVRAIAARDAMMDGKAFNGAPGADADRQSPSWSAFIGLYGYAASSDPAIITRMGPDRDAAFRNMAIKEFPSPERHRTQVFIPATDTTVSSWRSYQDSADRYRKAVAYGQGRAAADAWTREIEARFGAGARMSPNITDFDTYLQNPLVQSQMRDAMGLPAGVRIWFRPDGTRTMGLSPADYAARIWAPARDAAADRFLKAVLGNPAPFNGEFDSVGEESVKAVVVPILALGFSLVGLIVHVIKSVNYSSAAGLRVAYPIASRLPFMTFARISGLVVFASLVVFLAPARTDAITQSGAWQSASRTHGPWTASAMKWVIEVQATASPVAKAIGHVGPFHRIVPSLLPPGSIRDRALAM